MIANRAVVYQGSGRSSLERVDLPEPDRGELILRLSVSGLCGTDLFKLANDSVIAGSVLGHEIVGIVERPGPGTAFDPGARIVVPHHVACGGCAFCRRGADTLCEAFRENLLFPGGFSERVLVREPAVRFAARALPDRLSDDAAVFLEPAACVLRGIRRSGILAAPAPQSAAVLGGGSMGLLHVSVLRAVLPGIRIALSDPLAERRALAEALGAERAVTAGSGELARAAHQLGDGIGADAVFDCVGGATALEEGLNAGRAGGSLVLFAHARAGEAAGFDLNTLFKHERRVLGTYSGGLLEQREAFELLTSGRLDARALITHRMPLARFEDAVELCRAHEALKILFVPEAGG